MSSKIPVAVLGATGVVGQHFLALLNNHPWFEVVSCFASYERNFRDVAWYASLPKPSYINNIKIKKLDINEIASSASIVFSALPANIAAQAETDLVNKGLFVFSNASAHRTDENVPIIIPEVNSNHIELLSRDSAGGLITNSNCSTSGLVLGLAPFKERGIKQCTVATYQALSGAGYPGVSAMDVTANLLPHISGEEDKIARETKKILGNLKQNKIINADISVIASTFRVNVPYGHTEAVFLELENSVTEEEAKTIMSSFKGIDPEVSGLPSSPSEVIRLFEDPMRPQPRYDYLAGNGMTVSVGSVRVRNNILSFKLLVNNLIRGAAGGSVQNAELAYAKGYIK